MRGTRGVRFEVFNAVTCRTVLVTRWRWVAVVGAWAMAHWTGQWWWDWNRRGEGWL